MKLWWLRICLLTLLASWALAVGGHDFVLEDHHHDDAGPEFVIAQAWHSDLTPATSTNPVLPAAVVILCILQLVLLGREHVVPGLPEFDQARPRPPTLVNLLFRGPPARTLLQGKVYETGVPLWSNFILFCSGWPSGRFVRSLSTAAA